MFKKNNKKDFIYANPSQNKHEKGGPNSKRKGKIKDGQP
jgi:hypothetical protein